MSSFDFEITRMISDLMIYMQKFQHAHWLRARQLIPNVQKVEVECRNVKLNWLTGKSRKRNNTKWRTGYEKVTTFKFRVWRRMLRTKTPNKAQIIGWKSWSLGLLKRAMKKLLKSMNWGPWTKFWSSFMQQFLRKTGKITNLIAFMWWWLLLTDT